jgi:soluble cytochrome b562
VPFNLHISSQKVLVDRAICRLKALSGCHKSDLSKGKAMSISSLSGVGTDSASFQEIRKQIQQDVSNLESSLQSNNLSGAQSAFSALQQLLPGNSNTSNTSVADSTGTSFTDDISAIGNALSSGDLAGAQQAFSNLQNLIGSEQGSQTQSSTGYSAGGSSADPVANDINNLSSAFQSGDLSGAQSAFKQLLSDLSGTDSAQASGSSSSSDSTATSFKNDLDAIGKALSSGDLTGAQQAFSNLQNLISGQAQSSASAAGGSTSSTGTDAITTDFNNLSTALQSGDLKGAQAAFKQLQSDLSAANQAQASETGHYHHHHGAAADSISTDSASTSATANSTVSLLG